MLRVDLYKKTASAPRFSLPSQQAVKQASKQECQATATDSGKPFYSSSLFEKPI